MFNETFASTGPAEARYGDAPETGSREIGFPVEPPRDMIRISLRIWYGTVTVGKWGKSLVIRFPGEIAKAAGLNDGERVEIKTNDGDIFIRRAIPHFTLEDLFQGKNPEARRAIYAEAYDWGPDVGRELIEE
jgi:antitoxin component of MazEF toxin-antitoxin module